MVSGINNVDNAGNLGAANLKPLTFVTEALGAGALQLVSSKAISGAFYSNQGGSLSASMAASSNSNQYGESSGFLGLVQATSLAKNLAQYTAGNVFAIQSRDAALSGSVLVAYAGTLSTSTSGALANNASLYSAGSATATVVQSVTGGLQGHFAGTLASELTAFISGLVELQEAGNLTQIGGRTVVYGSSVGRTAQNFIQRPASVGQCRPSKMQTLQRPRRF